LLRTTLAFFDGTVLIFISSALRSTLAVTRFLYARALKLPLLPLMGRYFGAPFTVALSVCKIAFSVLSGLLMKRIIGIDVSETEKNRKTACLLCGGLN